MWMPEFACPQCGAALGTNGSVTGDGDRSRESVVCSHCRTSYGNSHGIWRFMNPATEEALAPFLRQYQIVRRQEGRHDMADADYGGLPRVAATDAHAGEWGVRRETYHHLLRRVLAPGRQPSAILDLGAGNGWLSHRLSRLGHHAVAVDVSDDDRDGLGVVRRHSADIVAILADFDALPLASSQFDIVVFNGSLHYAPNPAQTLAGVHRLLRPGGTLVVMDSPMFHADVDGVAMIAETVRRFADDYGVQNSIRQGRGYLTFALLAETAREMSLDAEFVPSRGALAWRLGRWVARFRRGRQPAAFGLWVAR
jgi:SAM-dependent methyltransferase